MQTRGSTAAVITTVPGIVKVMPFPHREALFARCYDNVRTLIQQRGGEPVFGWSLADFGPTSRGEHSVRPLYRRWVNHVVWSDERSRLWEVSPGIDNLDPNSKTYCPTEFFPDPCATFHILSDCDWSARPSRYVPVCAEGEEVARLLGQAHRASSVQQLADCLSRAVAVLQSLGYRDAAWALASPLEQHDPKFYSTLGIWLIVE